MTNKTVEFDQVCVEKKLKEHQLNHLKVSKRGNRITIYSEYEGIKENRCRFTNIASKKYILDMANHTGKWEPTPFEGSVADLLEMLIEQFPWMLTNYDEDSTM